jgi:Ca2+-binding RTX toxin-like protein
MDGGILLAQALPMISQAAGTQAIGRIDTVTGQGTVTRVDGAVVEATKGLPVYQGDTVDTPKGGKVGIVFADNTTFALGENGQMRLDEMVYNPSSKAGSLGLSMLKGAFVMVTGEIAPSSTDAMTIRTPVGTIGIRGTKIVGQLDASNGLVLSLLPDPVGRPAAVVVSNAAGTQFITEANTGIQIASYNSAPTAPMPTANLPGSLADVLAQVLAFVDGMVGDQIVQAIQQVADAQAAERAAAVRDADPDAAPVQTTQPGSVDGPVKVLLTSDVPLSDLLALNPELPTVTPIYNYTPSVPATPPVQQPTTTPQETQSGGSLTLTGTYIVGTGRDEVLIGTAGADELYGMGGNDLIIGLGGADHIDGGAGNDMIVTGNLGHNSWDETDGTATTIVGGAGSDSVFGYVEDAVSGSHTVLDVVLDGVESLNIDVTKMVAVADQTYQGLYIGGGALDSAPEIMLYATKYNLDVDLHINTGTDYSTPYTGSQGLKLNASALSNNLYIGGTDNNDVITAGSGHDEISGGDGSDKLVGGLGGDTLYGDDGTDTLIGGAGDDSLKGGDGNDVLSGGTGNDLMIGGAGADHFVGPAQGNDSFFYEGTYEGEDTYEGNDVIENFASGSSSFWFHPYSDIDTIAPSNFMTVGGAGYDETGGTNAPRFVFWDNGVGGGKLYYDSNGGDAGGGYVIAVIEHGTVTAGDIHVDFPASMPV